MVILADLDEIAIALLPDIPVHRLSPGSVLPCSFQRFVANAVGAHSVQ
jgi:hypothetical protein